MKKIDFLSSTKLLMATIGMIVGAFVLLSMSFPYDPAYSGPNVNGPKYSHTYNAGGGCSGASSTNHDDYGKVTVVSAGNGSVAIVSATNTNSSISGTTVTWHCGLAQGSRETVDRTSEYQSAHANTIKLSATPDAGYRFVKWVGSNGDESEDAAAEFTVSIPNDKEYKSTGAYAVTYTASFEKKVSATVTMSAAVGGTYTYSCPAGSGTISTADGAVTTADEITLTAVPADGYKFFGWYTIEGGNIEYFSYSETAVKAFGANTTIYAKFISENAALFTVGGSTGTQYWDLNEANAAAASASNKTIILVNDGVLEPGNYTISSGVTLLVPYKSDNTKVITTPSVPTSNQHDPISPYRKLTMSDGVNITCYGSICVGGGVASTEAGKRPTGCPTGPVGVIDMSEGGHIDLKSGSTLYVWGFIVGQNYLEGNNTQNVGSITAENGSTVWEDFALSDWRGGTATNVIKNATSTRCFPFQNYYVQNIEIPIRFEYGSTEKVHTRLYFATMKENAEVNIALIGSGTSMFTILGAGGAVTKWYDPTTDLDVFELEGNAKIDVLKVKASAMGFSMDIKSTDYDLPISSSFHIKLKDNMEVTSPILFQPGSVLEVGPSAELKLSEKLYMYDTEDWGKFVNGYYFYPLPTSLTQHRSRGTGSDKTLDDSKLIVHGKVTIATGGGLYTTTHAADIMSPDGGIIDWKVAIPADKNIYGFVKADNAEDAVAVPVTAAKLHNENDSYTASKSTTIFTNVHGRWFAGDAKNEKTNHTYDFTYLNTDADVTTEAIYWQDAAGDGHWNNATTDGVTTYANTWIGTEEEVGLTAYYCYTTYDQEGTAHSGWVKLTQIGTSANFGGSDNNMYMYVDSKWQSIGSTDSDCLYTVGGVRQALVGSSLVAITKNTTPEDGAWHDASNNYYVDLTSGSCIWTPATKVAGVEKAYVIGGTTYLRYDADGMGEDWMAVEYEAPFYYTVDDQNLRTYYEYNAGAGVWQLAAYKVSVTDKDGTKQYYMFGDAVAAASSMYNPTITLLADVDCSAITTITSTVKSTQMTLDLNGHIINSLVAKTIVLNSAGLSLTITDNSVEKNGQIRVVYSANATDAAGYAINVTNGVLVLNAGTLYAKNTNTGGNARSGVIYVAAGKELRIQGGRIEAESDNSYAYAINTAGTVNMTDGEVVATVEKTTAAGVLMDNAAAVLNVSGGRFFAEAKGSHLTAAGDCNAYTIYMNKACTATISGSTTINALVSNSSYGQNARGVTMAAGAKLTVTDNVQIEAVSYYKTAYGIVGTGSATESSRSIINIRDDAQVTGKARTNAFGISSSGVTNVSGGDISGVTEALADKSGSTTAYGINVSASANATATSNYSGTLNVTGGTISARAATTTAYGVLVNASYKINGTTNYNVVTGTASIQNATITATTGTTTAYGVLTYQDQNSTIIENCNITANAGSTTAYGVYVSGYQYSRGAVSNTVKASLANNIISAIAGKDTYGKQAYGVYVVGVQHTSNSSSGSSYITGEFAAGAEITIDGGSTSAIGTTETAAVYVGPTVTTTNGGASATPKATINGGTYSASGTASVYGIYARGTTLSSGATVDAVGRTGGTVYGVYVNGNKTTINSGSYSSTAYTTVSAGVRIAAGDLEINGGEFHALSQQETATKAANSEAYGIYIPAGFPMTIKNATFTAEATKPKYCQKIYGIYALSDVELINCNSTATSDNTYAYGTYVKCANATINGGTHTGIVKGSSLAKAGAAYGYGVFVDTDTKATISGATCVGRATEDNNKFCQYVYGVYANSNAEVNVADCNLSANGALNYTYGVLSLGDVTLTNNTINSTTTGTTAYGIFANASTAGVIGKITMESGTVNVSGTTTAYGGYANFAPKVSTSALYYSEAYAGVLTINGGEFNVTTTTGATAEGVRSFGTCEINDGTFNIQPKTATAVGVRIYDGTTTINGGTFNVTATTNTAYGVCPWAEVNTNYGYLNQGTVIVNDGKFIVRTLGGATAYGVYTYAAKKASFHPSKLTAATDLDAPDQACAATATINGGVFDVKASTNKSYGIYTTAKQTQGDAVAEAKTYVNDGYFFVANGDASAADAVYVGALKECHPIVGGHFNINKGLTSSTSSKNYVNTPYRVLDCQDAELKETYPYEVAEGYKVTFKNGTTVLQEGYVKVGAMPAYTGATPTKASDEQYVYTFKGWTPGIAAATEDATYTATYNKIEGEAAVVAGSVTTAYATFAEALSHVAAGNTLKLLNDVTNTSAQTLTTAMTLDLNGKVLTTGLNMFTVRAALTIKDEVGTGKVYASESNSGSQTYVFLVSGASLTINSGTIEAHNTYASATKSTYGIATNSSTVSMNDGCLIVESANNSYGIYSAVSSNVAVNGGEIKVQGGSSRVAYDINMDNVTLTATNGKFYVANSATKAAFSTSTTVSAGYYSHDTNVVAADGYMVAETNEYAGYNYKVAKAYTITFNTNGGTAIAPIKQVAGSDVTAPANPTKTGYTFAGWDKEIPTTMPAEDMEITANWTINQYDITWKNEDGTTLTTTKVNYNVLPTYTGATPTKAATAQYSYTFTGWTPAIVVATENATYTATYSSTTNKYTITWTDENDNVLGTDELDFGAMPSHADLTKAETVEYTYTWKGWNNAPVAVTGPATYKSLGFTATPKSYTLTWNLNGGNITTAGTAAGSVAFGTSLTAPVVEKTGYTFNGWDPAVPATMPAAHASYTAQWRANQYTVSWNANGGVLSGEYTNGSVDYGTIIEAPTATRDGYDFAGWSPEVPMTVKGDLSFEAQWTPAAPVDLGDWMDIVDWSATSVTLNMNGYSAANGSWKVKIGSAEKMSGNRNGDRTLTFDGLTLNGGEKLNIEVYGGDVLESKHDYTIPYIFDGSWTNDSPTADAVLYIKSGKMTINGNFSAQKVIVCPGAELVVASGKTLTTTDLVLRGKVWSYEQPILTNNGTINATNTYYTRIIADKSAYYPFGLPFASKVEDVRLSNGVKPSFGETSNWNLKYYDGAARANGEDGWKNLPEDKVNHNTTIAANTYYIMGSGSAYYREFYFPITLDAATTSMPIAEYASTNKLNAGWNGLCSPFTTVYSAHAAEPEDNVKITTKNEDNRTWTQDVAEQIYPFFPFFYQSAGAGTLNFGDEYFNFAAKTQASVAARAQAEEQQNVHTQWVQVKLTNNRGEQDKLNLYVHPSKFTSDYERRYDLAKMLGEGSTRPQVYTRMACGDLAFNAMPDSVAATRIPVGVEPGSATSLTFSLGIDEYLDRVEAIYLIDEALATTTNLLDADYQWNIQDGTDNRFYLSVVMAKAPENATGINANTGDNANKVKKVFINEKLYIIRGNQIYNANGKLVQNAK